MAIELTRDKLFEPVWQRPMTQVAADYGISDVALKKICVKRRIPVPGRGYWARRAAGHKVEQAILRPISDPALNRVVIYGSPSAKLPPAGREVKAAAKAKRARPEDGIEVVPSPVAPLPVVRRTKKKLLTAKPDEKGLISLSDPALFDIAIGLKSVDRVVAFLDAFVRAAKLRGYQPVKSNNHLVFMVDCEPLAFGIVESVERETHILTESERTAIDRLKTHSRRDEDIWNAALSLWEVERDIPKWDYFPNSKLKVRIDESRFSWDGIRRTFGDGNIQKIETLVTAIFDGLANCAAAVKAKRIKEEQDRIEREEEEKQRRERQRRRQRQEILDYVSAVEAKLETASVKEPDAVREWLAWARSYTDRLDPIADILQRSLRDEDFKF